MPESSGWRLFRQAVAREVHDSALETSGAGRSRGSAGKSRAVRARPAPPARRSPRLPGGWRGDGRGRSPASSIDRVRSSLSNGAGAEDAVGRAPETRGSAPSKTGSASTTTRRCGGLRPELSLRKTASVVAEGRFTISWPRTRGRPGCPATATRRTEGIGARPRPRSPGACSRADRPPGRAACGRPGWPGGRPPSGRRRSRCSTPSRAPGRRLQRRPARQLVTRERVDGHRPQEAAAFAKRVFEQEGVAIENRLLDLPEGERLRAFERRVTRACRAQPALHVLILSEECVQGPLRRGRWR